MAPERISGNIGTDDFEISKRADIWSLGVILYAMFSG
jgi:serine/threonine protein kinase